MGLTPLSIRFGKIYRIFKIYDRLKYLVLYDYGWRDKACNRIKYLISEKSGIIDNYHFARIKIDSYHPSPI